MMKNFTMALVLVFMTSSAYASETLKGAKKDLETFKQEMSVELEKAEKNLSAMKAKGSEHSQKAISDLTKKRDELKAQMDSLQVDTKGKWKQAKKSLSSSINNLNSKIQKALE